MYLQLCSDISDKFISNYFNNRGNAHLLLVLMQKKLRQFLLFSFRVSFAPVMCVLKSFSLFCVFLLSIILQILIFTVIDKYLKYLLSILMEKCFLFYPIENTCFVSFFRYCDKIVVIV